LFILREVAEILTAENPILQIQVQERVGEFKAWSWLQPVCLHLYVLKQKVKSFTFLKWCRQYL